MRQIEGHFIDNPEDVPGGTGPLTAASSQSAPRKGEQGWALLGMLLALTLIAIALMGVAPNVQIDVRREKEFEAKYRGAQMAEGIARYYNRGGLGLINLQSPPPYGYLYDLKKLKEGVTLGVTEIKFVRGSAATDPLTGQDWEPVRARDPRLSAALQAFAAYNNVYVPPSYLILAAPPSRLILNPTSTVAPSQTTTVGGSATTVRPGTPAVDPDGNPIEQGPSTTPPPPGKHGSLPDGSSPPGAGANRNQNNDDEDQPPPDPLAGVLQQGQSLGQNGYPIVAVATKAKGGAVTALYGQMNYKEWVFIYIPPQNLIVNQPGQIQQPNRNPNGNPRNPGGLRTSQ